MIALLSKKLSPRKTLFLSTMAETISAFSFQIAIIVCLGPSFSSLIFQFWSPPNVTNYRIWHWTKMDYLKQLVTCSSYTALNAFLILQKHILLSAFLNHPQRLLPCTTEYLYILNVLQIIKDISKGEVQRHFKYQ
jgi:hypothetical protein